MVAVQELARNELRALGIAVQGVGFDGKNVIVYTLDPNQSIPSSLAGKPVTVRVLRSGVEALEGS